MTICSKTLELVKKRLEERKSLDEIGQELCDLVDNPRGKALRLVRMAIGEDADKYLAENAEWLGYNTNYIRNPEGSKFMSKNTSERTSIIESEDVDILPKDVDILPKDVDILPKDVDVLPKDVEINFGLCVDNKRLHPFLNKVDKDNGIAIFGKLEESDIYWWVQIEPSVEIDAFGFVTESDLHYIKVTRFTRVYNKTDEYVDDIDNEEFKITIISTICPVKRCCVGFYIDCFMYPDRVMNNIKKFKEGLSDEFPKLPKFKKSQHPDWEWSYALTKRLTHKKWKENLDKYGHLDMALIDWDIRPYPVMA